MRSTPRQGLAEEVRRPERGTQVELHGAVEAQQLLDGRGSDVGLGPPFRHLVGVGEQREQPVPDRFVVVSKPAAKSRMAVDATSSSLSWSSFSLASTGVSGIVSRRGTSCTRWPRGV